VRGAILTVNKIDRQSDRQARKKRAIALAALTKREIAIVQLWAGTYGGKIKTSHEPNLTGKRRDA
jgi:hypothetical protein